MELSQEKLLAVFGRILAGKEVPHNLQLLQEHITTLEADRARMDWLEKNPKRLEHDSGGWYDESNRQSYAATEVTLRQAIDTAMQSPTQGANQV